MTREQEQALLREIYGPQPTNREPWQPTDRIVLTPKGAGYAWRLAQERQA